MEGLCLTEEVNAQNWEQNIIDLCFVSDIDVNADIEEQQTYKMDGNLVIIDTALKYKHVGTSCEN